MKIIDQIKITEQVVIIIIDISKIFHQFEVDFRMILSCFDSKDSKLV